MNNIIYFLKLVRLENLAIVALTQYLIKYNLINDFVNDFVLSDFNFSLLVFATLLITAGGYIINDIYDVDTDKINKNESLIIDKYISTKQAMRWYFSLNITALVLGIYLAFIVGRPILSIIFIYSIYSLWTYSKKFKKSLLIGNLQVAFLTSLSILNLLIFDVTREFFTLLINFGWTIYSHLVPDAWGYFIQKESIELINTPIILYIIIFYAGFSFLITFIREIMKDLEDMEGDKKINAKTLAIIYGIKKTKWISLVFTMLTFFGIAYFQYFQYSIISSEFEYEISIWGINKIAILYTFFLQILFLILGFKIYHSQIKTDFYFISQLCKLIMIIGILSIPLFTYLHLN